MRRLLKRRTWRIRGNNAAEASMIVALAAIVLPLLLFAGASWIAYGETRREVEERMARTLDLVYGNVRTTFETQSLVISNTRAILEEYGSASAIRENEERIHAKLRRLVADLPQIEGVWVLDADARPLASTNLYPVPRDLVASDRSYFVAHRDGARRHISEVLRGRALANEFFQYSERRDRPDGSFDGLIAVSVPPSYFTTQFSQISESKSYTAAIVRADGEVLARFPAIAGRGSRLADDTGFMRAIAAEPAAGRYTTERSGFDGVARIFTYRKLPDEPVYVALGVAQASIRDAWLASMASHLVFGVPATLCLVLLALVAARRAVQESDALARLREEQDRSARAEESLRQAQKMNAVGQLTAGIAHDFNNLLTGIGGALEMIRRRTAEPSPDVERFIELGRNGVARAATLTQRLLAFSRQQPLQIESIDANRLVTGMSELLRRTLGEKVRIETVLGGGLWRARADVAQLESAILNLAINGRDAMPEGGALTIETANAHLDDAYAAANVEVTPGQYVLIAVSDTGTGMEPEVIARAFEPFFTTKQRGQGTGLGLSMAFGYVKQVGGHLKIYSEVGHGTTVKLYLPRALGEADVVPEKTIAPVPRMGDGPVILVVEDDPVVRDFAVSACHELGCTVHQAGSGAEALAVLEANSDIALLFTDIGLPGAMNGRQLADAATARRPALKVLFTTGYTANAIVHHGMLDPGVNFIGKPFSIAALAAKIKGMGF
ncbi:MAG: response regulator [Enhydrobacter sp.]|nr:response regulator [Enhydrobacter sp.]